MRANFEGKRKAARNAIQRLSEMETAKKIVDSEDKIFLQPKNSLK